MKWLLRHRWLRLYSHMSGKNISIDTSHYIHMSQVWIITGTGSTIRSSFSGLQVSQASYLWSMEFWGTAGSKQLPIRRRIGIISVISIAILLATTIGPSSAILLIPRLAYWPAGSTNIWLNATFQDLWPDRSVLENIVTPTRVPSIRWGTSTSTGPWPPLWVSFFIFSKVFIR